MHKLTINKTFKHFNLINKHRWMVFKFSIIAGIPFRGLVHDLSKYSFVEFFESARYYIGYDSPLIECKKDIGYSKAWLHHKGRNKHHFEYWYDETAPDKTPLVPFNIFAEMVCDTLSANIIYNKNNWKPSTQINYWNDVREELKLNESIKDSLTEVYKQVACNGIKVSIKKANLKKIYNKYCK